MGPQDRASSREQADGRGCAPSLPVVSTLPPIPESVPPACSSSGQCPCRRRERACRIGTCPPQQAQAARSRLPGPPSPGSQRIPANLRCLLKNRARPSGASCGRSPRSRRRGRDRPDCLPRCRWGRRGFLRDDRFRGRSRGPQHRPSTTCRPSSASRECGSARRSRTVRDGIHVMLAQELGTLLLEGMPVAEFLIQPLGRPATIIRTYSLRGSQAMLVPFFFQRADKELKAPPALGGSAMVARPTRPQIFAARAPVPATGSGEPLGTDAEPGPFLSDGVRGPSHPAGGCSVTRPPSCCVTRPRVWSRTSILNRFASLLAGG